MIWNKYKQLQFWGQLKQLLDALSNLNGCWKYPNHLKLHFKLLLHFLMSSCIIKPNYKRGDNKTSIQNDDTRNVAMPNFNKTYATGDSSISNWNYIIKLKWLLEFTKPFKTVLQCLLCHSFMFYNPELVNFVVMHWKKAAMLNLNKNCLSVIVIHIWVKRIIEAFNTVFHCHFLNKFMFYNTELTKSRYQNLNSNDDIKNCCHA